ncbi:hypothetical protein BRC81_16020 [Halobacteriales archaeon QS_1_68_20]|nr:MAG: hypothetical protein BRC81_16020 [Halobacteriales archaeon QS_1_68_20]
MSRLDFRDRRIRGVPVLAGAINGVLTYVTGLVVLLLLYGGNHRVASLAFRSLWDVHVPYFTAVGFVHFGGHFVPVRASNGTTLNFALSVGGGNVRYVLLVVGLLVAGGWYLGSADWATDAGAGFRAGASLVVGYLPLVVWGAVTFVVRASPSGGDAFVLQVPFARAVLLAGVVFPVVFGGGGGVLAAET